MATIIAVHGTFATGPEEGEGWWQRGGALDRDIRELVEADDSRLDFAPHVWDGQNSETSRRAAGQALLQRLAALEQKGEKYCLIGHSHGGSVIASALFRHPGDEAVEPRRTSRTSRGPGSERCAPMARIAPAGMAGRAAGRRYSTLMPFSLKYLSAPGCQGMPPRLEVCHSGQCWVCDFALTQPTRRRRRARRGGAPGSAPRP
jgi:hypothetical protein